MILHDATVQYLVYLRALGLSAKRLTPFHRVLPDVLSFYGSETPLELFDDSMVLEYIKENDPFETDPVKVMRGDIFCKFVHWLMKNQLIPAWKEQMHKSEMEQTRSYYSQDDFRKENDHTLPFL